MSTNNLTLYFTHSLEKIFPAVPYAQKQPYTKASMLSNERFSWQLVYCYHGHYIERDISIEIISPLSEDIQIRMVGLAPSLFPVHPDCDDFILSNAPGLYPDPLFPLDDFHLLPNQYHSLWLTIPQSCQHPAGIYPITVIFKNGNGEELNRADFEIERIDAVLPKQTLIHTEWFHTDCIAAYHNVKVFSTPYWELVESYLKIAADFGINMILTPIFTPPLDTEVGKERPAVQLVQVEKKDTLYVFDFTLLKKWVQLCEKVGIQYFEFSHLFTQWGAGFAPKIMITEKGKQLRKFGWDTPSDSAEYQDFLSQFLPALLDFIQTNHLENKSFFHISDEPGKDQISNYKKAKDLLNYYLQNMPIMDALSDYDFYEQGLVSTPICATDHISPFLEHKVKNLWVYYCSAQAKGVSNRFFGTPSLRNRILGLQLYKYHIAGFLHWGFNFWFSMLSRYEIDPYYSTDAGAHFPSGDSFLVYPNKTSPLNPFLSLRLEVFYEGLQDLRALNLLEQYMSYEEIIEFLEKDCLEPISFSEYPKEDTWLLQIRDTINQKIKSLSCK